MSNDVHTHTHTHTHIYVFVYPNMTIVHDKNTMYMTLQITMCTTMQIAVRSHNKHKNNTPSSILPVLAVVRLLVQRVQPSLLLQPRNQGDNVDHA